MKLKLGKYYVDEDGDVFQLTQDYRGVLQSTFVNFSIAPFNNPVRAANEKEIAIFLEEKL